MINKFKQAKSFFCDYFGSNFLKKALVMSFGMFAFFILQKLDGFLGYKNELTNRINTYYKNNSISVLKYNQILQNNTNLNNVNDVSVKQENE